MGLAARIGDGHSHGGYITQGSMDVLTERIGQARVGDTAFCPVEDHGTVTITQGSMDTFVNRRMAARVGDSLSCGASITQGAQTVLIN